MRRASQTLVALVLALAPRAALADGVLLSEATPLQREQAQSRFRRGKELMEKKRYDEAAAEFRASHDIVASPNTRLELGRCMRAEGRLVPAYAEFGRTMVEAKELVGEDQRYQRAYDAAAAERGQLEPRLGFVVLTVDNPSESTRVIIGDQEIRRAAWGEPAPVDAGSTEIRVETPGRAPISRTLTIAAGHTAQAHLDAQLDSAGPPPSGSPSASEGHGAPDGPQASLMPLWPSYVGYGVAGATVVSALYVGLASVSSARGNANNTGSSITNAGGVCPAPSPRFAASCSQYSSDLSLIQTDKAIAYTLTAASVALVAGSTVWLVLALEKRREPASAEPPTTAVVAPLVGPTVAGLSVAGAF
jgi:hypothetical protein